MLPALSKIDSNSGLSHAIWNLIKLYPYTTRYALYGQWKESYAQPEMLLSAAACRKDMGYILNRLSKDNVKVFGRHIAKIVHSNPIIAFPLVLNTIEGYDNMIPYIVEATRYLTDLDLDVLSYSLIESLCKSKPRIERNGTTVEKWLKSLSTFCGSLFKKHNIELDGMLTYITNQLLSNQVYDLVVLHELVSSMSGIAVSESYTAIQIANMQGGKVLRTEAHLQDRTILKSTERLLKSLKNTKLAGVIATLIAQQRQDLIFRMGSDEAVVPDVKVMGWTFDLTHKSLLLFMEFLGDFGGEIAWDFRTLVEEFGVDVSVAFFLLRPMFSSSDGDANEASSLVHVADDVMDVDAPDTDRMDVDTVPPISPEDSLITSIKHHVDELKLSGDLHTGFFVTFWKLSLADISVPTSRYESEINKLAAKISDLEANTSTRGVSKRLKEIKNAIKTRDALMREAKTRNMVALQVLNQLKAEKDEWFNGDPRITANLILQHCIYPRCVFSPLDALFCGKFLFLLHSIATPNLSFVSLLDSVICC